MTDDVDLEDLGRPFGRGGGDWLIGAYSCIIYKYGRLAKVHSNGGGCRGEGFAACDIAVEELDVCFYKLPISRQRRGETKEVTF